MPPRSSSAANTPLPSASSSTHHSSHHHHHLFHRTSQPSSSSASYAPSASSSTATTPTTHHAHVFQTEVVTNKHAVLGTHDRSGRKMVNQYIVMEVIGKGMHGTVRRGIDSRTGEMVTSPDKNSRVTFIHIPSLHPENDDSQQAIKIVERVPKHKRLGMMYAKQHHGGRPHARVGPGAVSQQLRTTEDKIKREIAIMKKCQHSNVVNLKEVIDDPHNKRIFLILEYLEGGELKWRSPPPTESPTLEVEQTRQIFRQVILGLEYFKSDGTVKISDFGVSQFSYALRLQSAGANAIRTSSPSPRRPPAHQDSAEDPTSLQQSPGAANNNGAGAVAADEDVLMDESDLCKTAGSPAFFAPELCYQGGSGVMGSLPSFGGSSLPSPTTFGGVAEEMFIMGGGGGAGGLPSSAPMPSGMMLAVPPSESASSGVGTPQRAPSSASSSSHSHVQHQQSPPSQQQQQQQKERPHRPKFFPSRQHSSNSSTQTTPIAIPISPSTPTAGLASPTSTTAPNLAGASTPGAPPPVTAAIDIWALGVTLYCLLFGKPPFNAPTEFMLYKIIPNEDFVVPDRMGKDQKKTGG
ncbi:hypothetical protein FRC01_004598, partial [Tulasnella sp. 417]